MPHDGQYSLTSFSGFFKGPHFPVAQEDFHYAKYPWLAVLYRLGNWSGQCLLRRISSTLLHINCSNYQQSNSPRRHWTVNYRDSESQSGTFTNGPEWLSNRIKSTVSTRDFLLGTLTLSPSDSRLCIFCTRTFQKKTMWDLEVPIFWSDS